jgi:uncharacterized protein (TIGR03089 family)
MTRFAQYAGDTVSGALATAVAADPTRPLLTYYDDATGERTELSGATLDNWVAKTANLLVDGCGLTAGDRAAVALPPHWQSAAVLLGCWSVGLTMEYGVEPAASRPADVLFATADQAGALPAAGDCFLLGLAPMALPLRQVPAGFADYVAEVRGFGDRYSPVAEPGDQADLVARARERASELGIAPGDRVLVDADRHPDPLDWLLAPLVAGATIVLCGHLDPGALARRFEAERVTVSLTVP